MFNFNGSKKIFFAISLVLMLASAVSLIVQGFNLDTDFAGGMAVTYEIKADCEVKDIEAVVSEALGANKKASSVQKSDNGEVIIKFVNSADEAQVIDFTLDGVTNVAPEGRAITLQADDLGDENSMDNPTKIVPVEKTFKKFGQTFSYEFPKYSFTILRVKVEK